MRDNNRLSVWTDPTYAISAAADSLVHSSSRADCLRSQLPYGEAKRSLQVDIVVYDNLHANYYEQLAQRGKGRPDPGEPKTVSPGSGETGARGRVAAIALAGGLRSRARDRRRRCAKGTACGRRDADGHEAVNPIFNGALVMAHVRWAQYWSRLGRRRSDASDNRSIHGRRSPCWLVSSPAFCMCPI